MNRILSDKANDKTELHWALVMARHCGRHYARLASFDKYGLRGFYRDCLTDLRAQIALLRRVQ